MTCLGFASEYFNKGQKKKKRDRWRKCGKILTLLNFGNWGSLNYSLYFYVYLKMFVKDRTAQMVSSPGTGTSTEYISVEYMSEMDLARRQPWSLWLRALNSWEYQWKKERKASLRRKGQVPWTVWYPVLLLPLTDQLPPSHHTPLSWDPAPASQGPY